ncbi:hypothetical protein CSOJ01_11646 [Colletotrichum sojae]|uniref:Uncharacterized protein n=1 Tax=Colletotrichum sojae TaxID=2175907 RepID=A0A8H6IXB7_9PEZI|nr:hypothetical protein CSOJ01_11646 [Colletotrichum sojae]
MAAGEEEEEEGTWAFGGKATKPPRERAALCLPTSEGSPGRRLRPYLEGGVLRPTGLEDALEMSSPSSSPPFPSRMAASLADGLGKPRHLCRQAGRQEGEEGKMIPPPPSSLQASWARPAVYTCARELGGQDTMSWDLPVVFNPRTFLAGRPVAARQSFRCAGTPYASAVAAGTGGRSSRFLSSLASPFFQSARCGHKPCEPRLRKGWKAIAVWKRRRSEPQPISAQGDASTTGRRRLPLRSSISSECSLAGLDNVSGKSQTPEEALLCGERQLAG